MKRLLAVILALVPFYAALAQSPSYSLVWETKFNFGGNFDQPRSIAVTPSNDFLIEGFKHLSSDEKRAAIVPISSAGTVGQVILDTTIGGAAWGNQLTLPVPGNSMYLALQVELTARFYLTYRDAQGVEVWRMQMGSDTYLASYGDSVIATSGGNAPVCYLIAPDGTVKRQFSLGSRLVRSVPRLFGDTLYVSGETGTSSSLRAFDLETESLLWERSVPKGVLSASTVDDSGNVYFAGSFTKDDSVGYLYQFAIRFSPSGLEEWRNEYVSRETYETNYENRTESVAASSEKNLVVVGGSIQRGSIHDWNRSSYLEGFAASTGISVWKKVWYVAGTTGNLVRSVRFDHNSNLIALSAAAGSGNYFGYLQKYQVDKVTKVEEVETNQIPESFTLSQNYPNPFNPSTSIRYSVPRESEVSLVVYDVTGREVETLVRGMKHAGTYEVHFTASHLPSGVYFYRLIAGSTVETKKMMLLK